MKKILLIEDEEILAEMYRDKFSEAGFKVFLASDSKEGLELTKKEKPDLIILDILLPKESGIVFLEWLRKNEEIASIPVLALSNYDNPETKREAIKLGVKEYLLKSSYTPEEIVKKIKSYLKEEKQ